MPIYHPITTCLYEIGLNPMFVGICNPDAVSIRIFNPKKRTENTYTLFGRIAKLRLSVVQIHLNTAEREQFIKIPQKEF